VQLEKITFTVYAEPAAKSNQRRVVRIKGKKGGIRVIKSAKALAYVDTLRDYAPKPKELMLGDLAVEVKTWYASRRPDLSIELILDAMQGVLYKNDRQVKEHHAYWMGVDKDNPRSEITVWTIEIEGGS